MEDYVQKAVYKKILLCRWDNNPRKYQNIPLHDTMFSLLPLSPKIITRFPKAKGTPNFGECYPGSDMRGGGTSPPHPNQSVAVTPCYI